MRGREGEEDRGETECMRKGGEKTFSPSSKDSTFACTRAVYSPRLNPATALLEIIVRGGRERVEKERKREGGVDRIAENWIKKQREEEGKEE
jgi:hypothetical protein